MFVELVVPPKRPFLCTPHADRRCSRGDFNRTRSVWSDRRRRQNRVDVFALDRQLVQHVAQRFDMHQAMPDSDIEQAAIFETREIGVFRGGGAQRVMQRLAQSRVAMVYLLDRWPIHRLVIGQAPIHRVDPEGEEPIEIGVESRKPERS